MAGAATDARETSVTARHAARTRELATGAATNAGDAALPARTTAGTTVLSTGAAVAVGVAALAAWVLLEDDMNWRWSGCRSCRERFSCRHRRNSNRGGNSATDHQRFHQIEFR